MVIQGNFDLLTIERQLAGGGLLVITGQRQRNGWLKVIEVRFYPKVQQQAA